MNNKPNLILDFETLSEDMTSCAVIDCAYMLFSWERFLTKPYTFEELIENITYTKLNVKDQVKRLGYKITQKTLKFWEEQESSVRNKIKPSPKDVSVETFINKLVKNTTNKNIRYWWSRSNTFDPIILYRLATAADKFDEIYSNLPHWGVRDTRSFIDAKTNFNKNLNSFVPMDDPQKWNKIFKKHDCVHDIAADILRLQVLTRLENDLPNK